MRGVVNTSNKSGVFIFIKNIEHEIFVPKDFMFSLKGDLVEVDFEKRKIHFTERLLVLLKEIEIFLLEKYKKIMVLDF